MSVGVLASRWFKYKVAFYLLCHTVMVQPQSRAVKQMGPWAVISEVPDAQFKGAKWVSHQSDTAANSQAPIGVTDSHKVAIFMGEFWLKKKIIKKYDLRH